MTALTQQTPVEYVAYSESCPALTLVWVTVCRCHVAGVVEGYFQFI